MKKIWPELLLIIILSLWLGATIAVDFIAIPNVFRNVSDLEQAGAVGMNVFSQFNSLELFLSLSSFASLFTALGLNIENLKRLGSILRLGSLSVLTVLAVGYLFFLTPTLTTLALEKNNTFEDQTRLVLENQLQFYHLLYIRLDSVKIAMILFALVMAVLSVRKHFSREAI